MAKKKAASILAEAGGEVKTPGQSPPTTDASPPRMHGPNNLAPSTKRMAPKRADKVTDALQAARNENGAQIIKKKTDQIAATALKRTDSNKYREEKYVHSTA